MKKPVKQVIVDCAVQTKDRFFKYSERGSTLGESGVFNVGLKSPGRTTFLQKKVWGNEFSEYTEILAHLANICRHCFSTFITFSVIS